MTKATNFAEIVIAKFHEKGDATESPTVETMMEKLNIMAPELLAENGTLKQAGLPKAF